MSDAHAIQRSVNSRISKHIPAIAWNSTVAVPPTILQLGAATVFQVADVHFVVTAAHVVRAAGETGKPSEFLAVTTIGSCRSQAIG
jgi:hypothetical protein